MDPFAVGFFIGILISSALWYVAYVKVLVRLRDAQVYYLQRLQKYRNDSTP